MIIEKHRFNSEAAPHPRVSQGEISGNDFAAIVPVIAGQIGGRETSVVSARAIHAHLGVDTRFTDWMKRRIAEYKFTEGVDYVVVEILSDSNLSSAKSRQKITHDHVITLTSIQGINAAPNSDEKGGGLIPTLGGIPKMNTVALAYGIQTQEVIA